MNYTESKKIDGESFMYGTNIFWEIFIKTGHTHNFVHVCNVMHMYHFNACSYWQNFSFMFTWFGIIPK